MGETQKHAVTLRLRQAYEAVQALDMLTRLGLAQMDCIESAIRFDLILMRREDGEFTEADFETCDRVKYILGKFQNAVGFATNASYGIFNERVPLAAKRAWEIKKILEKTLAEEADPNPSFRGVNYDGLSLRNTDDPMPVVTLKYTMERDVQTVDRVCLDLSEDQLSAFNKAMSVYNRIKAGEYEVLAELVAEGSIPKNKDIDFGCHHGTQEDFEGFSKNLNQIMNPPITRRA